MEERIKEENVPLKLDLGKSDVIQISKDWEIKVFCTCQRKKDGRHQSLNFNSVEYL